MKRLTLEEFWEVLEATTYINKRHFGLAGVLNHISVLYAELAELYKKIGDEEQANVSLDRARDILKELKRRKNA